MNEIGLVFTGTWILIAVMLMIQPWLTRKNVLFGVVFGSGDIWKDQKARQIRLRYLYVMIPGAALLGIVTLLYIYIAKPSEGTAVMVYFAGIAALLVLGTAAFIAAHARTRALKAGREPDANLVSGRISIETSLSDKKTVIPAAWLLALLPVPLAAYGVALFGYPAMPARIPIHYNWTSVDAWAPKSWINVLLPLLIGTVVTAFLFMCCLLTRRAPASVRGNPEAAPESFRFRRYMNVLLIILTLVMETSFLLVEIGFLIPVSPLWFAVPSLFSLVMIIVLLYVYFRFVRVKNPKGPILDDDAKWALGIFYYNPSDPSLFVEKRTGVGYTINFAKPAGWILLIGIIALAVVTIVFSAQSK